MIKSDFTYLAHSIVDRQTLSVRSTFVLRGQHDVHLALLGLAQPEVLEHLEDSHLELLVPQPDELQLKLLRLQQSNEIEH